MFGGPDIGAAGEKATSTNLMRPYALPTVRYVLTNASPFQPYVGVGAGLSWWTTNGAAQVGPDGSGRKLSGEMTLDVMATAGTYIKIWSNKEDDKGGLVLFELGGKVVNSLKGDVFAENQLAIVPFAGLTMLAGIGGR